MSLRSMLNRGLNKSQNREELTEVFRRMDDLQRRFKSDR
jgi:hypothetical protein